jgi:hypothetical protein
MMRRQGLKSKSSKSVSKPKTTNNVLLGTRIATKVGKKSAGQGKKKKNIDAESD